MRARWAIAGWPTDHWAGQVYPELEPLVAKRRLARDLLRFCRLADEDGKGASGWLKHLRTLSRRSARLTKLGLARLELRGPGTELDVGFVSGTRWLGGPETLVDGRLLAPNMPTEEIVHEPRPARDERDVPLHVPALVPRPAHPRAPRRVLERAARPARGRLERRSRFRRRLHRHRRGRDGGSARSRSSTPRRASARRAGSTTTRCSTRTPLRTSRSAAVSAAPVRRRPHEA